VQAVILAGGLATRMHPRTLHTPKALLEVAGRPFVAWQLERIARAGYERVLLCVGHLGEQVEALVRDGAHFDLSVAYSFDGPRLLGTAGALRRALDKLDDTFLVTYGDSFLPFDYAAPLRDLDAHPEALATMSVFKNEGRWDTSNTAVAGSMVARYEKGSDDPALDHIDYGATALRRSVIAELSAGEPCGLDAIQARLAREGRLRAYQARERFYEIGSEEGLRELEQYLRQNA
jgi:MurNAc alpha-1-phosphate uridylyltransferase